MTDGLKKPKPKKPGGKGREPDDEYGELTEPETFRIERLLPGPIERVWSYLTEPEKRKRWFGAGPMELRAGGRVKLQFKFSELSAEKTPPTKGDECEIPGRVTRCDPPRLAASPTAKRRLAWPVDGTRTLAFSQMFSTAANHALSGQPRFSWNRNTANAFECPNGNRFLHLETRET
jgi:hypothetical protein